MNLVLTPSCNKGCSYCFASKFRAESKDVMTFDTLKDIVSKTDQVIKLIGGEPTIHPEFLKFINYLVDQNREFVIISNFLFTEEVLKGLMEVLIRSKVHIGFLINSTELDEKNRMEKFKRNYNMIYSLLYKLGKEDTMSCGITFDNNRSIEYYMTYYDYLIENLVAIERMRLSINFPGAQKDKGDFYVINNKELGKKFVAMAMKSMSIKAPISVDCIIFPCMFSREDYKFLNKFFNPRSICDGAPADLFPNMTLSHGYPLKESISINLNKYTNYETAASELKLRYDILESTVELPEECKVCRFNKEGLCHGPCLAFYDLSEEAIGIND